jgi:hypothetical protein
MFDCMNIKKCRIHLQIILTKFMIMFTVGRASSSIFTILISQGKERRRKIESEDHTVSYWDVNSCSFFAVYFQSYTFTVKYVHAVLRSQNLPFSSDSNGSKLLNIYLLYFIVCNVSILLQSPITMNSLEVKLIVYQ